MAHRPTPHSIAVATLIALHCQEDSPLYQNGGNGTEFKLVDSFLRDVLLESATTGTSWASLHGRSVQSLVRQLQAAVDKGNSAICYTMSNQTHNEDDMHGGGDDGDRRITTAVSSSIARHFHGWLIVATSSIDTLTDLMVEIQRAVLSDGCVDATSVHGVFLRSCVLGYDELPFASVIALWNDFAQQVRNDNDDETDAAAYQPQWMISSQQVETAILEQCWKTASLVSGEPRLDEMQRDLQRILELNPELAAAHLLRFILCLKSGERVGAMDALHQYMDYAVSSSAASAADHHGGEDMLQFAAILRAVLHDHFGERRLVESATDEAVRVAQQSQDVGAVAFALGWLSVYHRDEDDDNTARNLTSYQPRQSSLLMMQRCVQRAAAAGNLRPLWAGGHFAMAVQSQSWTPLVQAVTDPTAVVSTSTGSDDAMMMSGRGDRPTHASYLDERYTGTTATVAAARQKLVAAGLYNQYGETTLSAQASVSALYCQNDSLSATDVIVAVHNLSVTSTSGSTAWMDWNAVLERRPLEAMKTTTSPEDCIYGNVLRTFIGLREKYRLPIDGVFHFDLALVLHEWAVRRRDMGHAQALLTAMESHLHPRIDNFEEIKFDIEIQKALLLSRREQWNDANMFLADAIARCKSAKQYGATARLLLQQAMVHLESCPTHFMNALHPLLQCLTICKEHKMDGLEDSALLILAQVHLHMGQCQRTVQILRVVLPRLSRHGHVWLQAEAYLTLAKCHMTKAKDCGTHSPKQCKVLQAALHELRRSVLFFSKCHDCHRLQEVYYLTAIIYNALPNNNDNQNLRDEAAKAFVHVRTHPASQLPSDILAAMSSRDGILELANRPFRDSADSQ